MSENMPLLLTAEEEEVVLFEPGHWQRFKKDNDDGYDITLSDSSSAAGSGVEEGLQQRSEDYVVTGHNVFLTGSSTRYPAEEERQNTHIHLQDLEKPESNPENGSRWLLASCGASLAFTLSVAVRGVMVDNVLAT